MTEDAATRTPLPDRRSQLRFERTFRHPPEAVWRALTDPDEQQHWFPCRIEGLLAPGEALRFVFPAGEMEDTTGQVLEADPPRVLAFNWETDVLRFELAGTSEGCHLVFTHVVDEAGPNAGLQGWARTAAGWDGCLTQLAARLDGGDVPAASDGWSQRNEDYLERFADR